jgi:DNA-damage-inducible protein J
MGTTKMMNNNMITHDQPELKEQAEMILQELGIPLSVAYEMFYRQIVLYRGLPFELRLPNKTTIEAMEEAREGRGKRYDTVDEMFADLED